MKAHRCRHRLALLLAALFDQLRTGALVATGRPAVTPTASAAIPAALWDASATLVERRSGDVFVGGTRAFIGVDVAPPVPQPRPLPEATAREFLAGLAVEFAPSGRTFTAAEAARMIRDAYPGSVISDREIARLLRQLRPAAWSAGGRRQAARTPTDAELAAAATLWRARRRKRACRPSQSILRGFSAVAGRSRLRVPYVGPTWPPGGGSGVASSSGRRRVISQGRMIDENVLSRFRAVVAGLRAATGAMHDAETRMNDQHRHIARLRGERDRLAAPRYAMDTDHAHQRREVAAAEHAIAEAEAEAARLAAEAQRLRQRRDDAAAIAHRCRDYLRERNALPPGLDF
jgi:hypothetical protein